jgi:putative intracellular protease/amidase
LVSPDTYFQNCPEARRLDIPGGIGTRAAAPALNSTIDFVRQRFPELQYLITICTVGIYTFVQALPDPNPKLREQE